MFLPGSKTIVTFFGPDVDASRTGSFEANQGRRVPLETTVSSVIRSSDIADLPLAGRDAYTMLVTQPGVSSDGATARGLGLAANGQRPSASNFMLDGLENNNYLITGPLVTGCSAGDSGVSGFDQQLLRRIRAHLGLPGQRHYPQRSESISRNCLPLSEERNSERKRISAESGGAEARTL